MTADKEIAKNLEKIMSNPSPIWPSTCLLIVHTRSRLDNPCLVTQMSYTSATVVFWVMKQGCGNFVGKWRQCFLSKHQYPCTGPISDVTQNTTAQIFTSLEISNIKMSYTSSSRRVAVHS